MYLFSHAAIRQRFQGVMYLLVYLGVLGLVLIPSLFFVFKWVEHEAAHWLMTHHGYEQSWLLMAESGYEPPSTGFATSVLNPDILARRLSWIHDLADYDMLASLTGQLQRGMFFVVTLVGFFELGAPSILAARFSRGIRWTPLSRQISRRDKLMPSSSFV